MINLDFDKALRHWFELILIVAMFGFLFYCVVH